MTRFIDMNILFIIAVIVMLINTAFSYAMFLNMNAHLQEHEAHRRLLQEAYNAGRVYQAGLERSGAHGIATMVQCPLTFEEWYSELERYRGLYTNFKES